MWCRPVGLGLLALLTLQTISAQTPSSSSLLTNPPIVLTVEGTNVWVQRFRSNLWESAYPSQILRVKDRGRTGADSRTSVRLSDLSVLRIGWHSEFEIQPHPKPEVEAEFSLLHGLMRLLEPFMGGPMDREFSTREPAFKRALEGSTGDPTTQRSGA